MRRTLFGLLGYISRYKAALLFTLALSFLGVAVELARPWPIKVVADYALAGRPLPAWLSSIGGYLPGGETPTGILVWSVVAGVLIVVTGAALSLSALYVSVRVSQRLVYDLALDVFEKLQRLSLSYHSRHPLGDLLQRVSQDVFFVFHAISQVVLPAAVSLLYLTGMFVIMASLDITLALVSLAVVPPLAASIVFFARPMGATTTRTYASHGAFTALAEQSLSAIRAVQGFAREAYVRRKVEERARDLSDAYEANIMVSGRYKEVTNFITGTGAALLLGLGGARVLGGQISLGDLLVFLGYLAALYGPVSELSLSVSYAVQVAARGKRVFEILDAEEEVSERPDAVDLDRSGRPRGEVIFEGVTFGYDQPGSGATTRPVLSDVSFRARPGQTIAIVGATGAGKSSLVSLLSRFYDPWEGRVLVDGHDVRDLSLRSLRENVSLVLQEPFLFPMSVADNIGFGRPEASRAEIVAAARAAQAHGFVERLPDGYDTVIGERGGSLSGGERQRIAIARAVLKDAPILVLDEPTSALDAYTEARIFEALSHLMRGKTTFVISHRLTTIRRAEQVLVFEGGRVVERGTHESLLEKGEAYARLYRHQHLAAM
ncbi:MAG: ABC transporter ATP-binding protein/permease [Actinomycetota bacterium]|nr:ABC transporter ATP-binding protein/permease [Actinomycetota bacterium]